MYRNKEYLQNEYINKNRTQQSIGDEWGVSPKLIHYYVQKFSLNHIKSRIKHTIDLSRVDYKNPIFCYYAGLVATDGYVDSKNHRISLRFNNKESLSVLKLLKNYFKFTGDVRKYKNSYDLTITSKYLIEYLENYFGIYYLKPNLDFPKYFYNDDCMRMFLRGVYDGDGSICSKVSKYTGNYIGGSFNIVKQSKRFIQGIIDCINKKFCTNINLTFHKKSTSNGIINYPKCTTSNSVGIKFFNWIYKGYRFYKFLDKYNRFRRITKVKI